MDSDLNVDRSRTAARGNFFASDNSGYIHAYGWSLRAPTGKAALAGHLGGGGGTLMGHSGAEDSGTAQASQKFKPIFGGTSSAQHLANDHHVAPISDSSGLIFSNSNQLSGLQVPIPQYCRPLTGDSLGMKIWCATAIDLSGGDLESPRTDEAGAWRSSSTEVTKQRANPTDSSGSIVNITTSTPVKSPSQRQALRQLEQEVRDALDGASIESSGESDGHQHTRSQTSELGRPILKATTSMVLNALPYSHDVENFSTCVWICSTQHSRSKINIIDIKTKPNELLDSFYVPTFVYCIKSVPGCKPSDLLGLPSSRMEQDRSSQSETGDESASSSKLLGGPKQSSTFNIIDNLIGDQRDEFYKFVRVDPEAEEKLRRDRLDSVRSLRNLDRSSSAAANNEQPGSDGNRMSTTRQSLDDDAEISRILDNNITDGIATLQKLNDFVAHTQPAMEDQDEKVGVKEEKKKEGDNVDGHEKEGGTTSHIDERKESQDFSKQNVYYQPFSTHLPTVWMGGKDCVLYVHSAMGQWKDCVACVELRDSILQICHFRGRVFVSLADGSLCVFFRNNDTKKWDLSQYLMINIGLLAEATNDSLGDLNDEYRHHPDQDDELGSKLKTDLHAKIVSNLSGLTTTSILAEDLGPNNSGSSGQHLSTEGQKGAGQSKRTKLAGVHCLEIANKNLWLGYRSRVLIFDPITMRLKHSLNVVPQMDNQIRQLVSMKDGVFICLRSDLILRLYSSLKPYQHIQNIDIEPVVTRLISPKTFVISHITAMHVVDNNLWIGIAHGIILTIPCKLVPQIAEAPIRNNQTGLFEESPSHLSIAKFVPKCDLNNAQISFHGHRDAVKFFICAHRLMLSGGQGYVDFRLDMDDQPKTISDKSHLILWQLPG